MTHSLRGPGAITLALILTASLPAAAAAAEPAEVAQGGAYFNSKNYEMAFRTLKPYRARTPGTLKVDFMLSASACRIDYPGLPAWGKSGLTFLPTRYKVDAPTNQLIEWYKSNCGRGAQKPTNYAAMTGGTSGTFMEAFLKDLAASSLDKGTAATAADATLAAPGSTALRDAGATSALRNGSVQAPAAAKLGAAGALNRQ